MSRWMESLSVTFQMKAIEQYFFCGVVYYAKQGCFTFSNRGWNPQIYHWQDSFRAPFNNMWTLKFKIQPTVALFTAVNHCSEPLRKQKRLAQRDRKVKFVPSDWWILIYFVGFCVLCGRSIVTVIMIDSSKTRKSLVGVEVLSVLFFLVKTVVKLWPRTFVQNKKHFCNHKRRYQEILQESKPVLFSEDISHFQCQNLKMLG